MSNESSTTKRYPLLRPDATVVPDPDVPGYHILTSPRGFEVALDAGAMWVASSFDGTQTCAQIAVRIGRGGLHGGTEGYVLGIAEHLEAVEVLTFLPEPLAEAGLGDAWLERAESLAPLTHHCTGCGRSCQGHLVAPLEASFLSTIGAIHEGLRAHYPDLEGVAPTQDLPVEGEPGRTITALSTRPEARACVFLGDDNLCRIHKHYGAEAKPIQCRMFPFAVVATEQGLRVGLSPRCYTYHESFEGPAHSSLSVATGVAPHALPAPLVRILEDSPVEDAAAPSFASRELSLLACLREPTSTLADVLRCACGLFSNQEPASIDLDAFVSPLSGTLRALGAALLEDPDLDLGRPLAAETHDAYLHDFATWLTTLSSRPFGGIEPPWRRFGLHVFAQSFFIRDWVDTPSWSAGAVSSIIGLVCAQWYMEDHRELEAAFPRALTVWMRSVSARLDAALPYPAGYRVLVRAALGESDEETPTPS